jgi:hypothetical protein
MIADFIDLLIQLIARHPSFSTNIKNFDTSGAFVENVPD